MMRLPAFWHEMAAGSIINERNTHGVYRSHGAEGGRVRDEENEELSIP